MALKNKKKSEIKHHIDVEEFIPYAAHFDEETVITKNGELLQIIKITGFAFESVKDEKAGIASLRSLIRNALKKNIKTDNFSLWIHTIRRERDISTGGVYRQNFSQELNEKWVEQNKWRSQFVNELYITVIIEGEYFSIRNPGSFIDNLFIKTELNERKEALLQAAKKLSAVTSNIINDLQNFGARKLSIFKRDGIYYSEIISLISKLMNLRQQDIPVAAADLSTVLPTHKVSFQYNTVMVEGDTGKHFGAVFSVKEYREVTENELDKLIQLPVNFIISQSFDFVPREKVLETFDDQKKIYEMSGAKRMMDISGIKEIYEVKDGVTDFGEYQIIITVLEDSVKGLQKAVYEVVDTLREMGSMFVREDLFMENCYWSTMPANFDFIKRQAFLPFTKIGGFAALHNFTTGKLTDNNWGNAVTAFPTRNNMPYFFNFHSGKNGHTLITGIDKQERSVLTNFLISQSQKFDVRTIFVETDRYSEVFVRAMGGRYVDEQDFGKALQDKEVKTIGVSLNQSEYQKLSGIINDIESVLDNTPTIVFLGVQISKVNDSEFISLLEGFAARAIDKNAIIIFSSDGSGKAGDAGVFNEAMLNLIKTRIFFPNPKADFDFKETFGLKESEFKQVKKLNIEVGEFMIKRNNDSVIVKFDFDYNKKQLPALFSNPEEIQVVEKAISESGSNEPEKWLPIYYKLAAK